ncbi:tRNA lysidine(34) synthetase TilS [Enterococcus sp. MSG2901]|uniref:tRNA(Ile)-lysidine synthase n=1 Tax=Candidatus Enterococcus courvalinii TaxID=2815329 RepID=A0ABS3I0T5_9ENTE|nr:tRNA lysidine(34) synthetase TilS [Enterococcus sp. MSG2901]
MSRLFFFERRKIALKESFSQLGQQKHFWSKKTKILVAVSGGVDSMVLLDLLLAAQQKDCFTLGVVHVNHQLRVESAEEEQYLQKYTKEKNLPFYSITWELPAETGVETAARQFRYQTFSRIMYEKGYDTLMTAHHGDDQIETILMKILRGGQLNSFAGIKEIQPFATGKLIRPLLSYNKEQLYEYANKQQLIYFEDVTNQELDVQRNRLRHLVVPQLKEENVQALRHFQRFSKQIQWADELIQKQMSEKVTELLEPLANGWQISAANISAMAESERYFFLHTLFEQLFNETTVAVKEQQVLFLVNQWQSEKSQWQFDLGKGWVFKKEYMNVRIEQSRPLQSFTPRDLLPNQPIYLSDSQWIGLFSSDKIAVPENLADWSEFRHDLWLEEGTELQVDRRLPGDRIRLTETLTKKISRYFIDKKIPDVQRKQAYLITDAQRNVYSVAPFVFSYLSIAKETDKIHYILLYKYQKKQLEGEPNVRKGY